MSQTPNKAPQQVLTAQHGNRQQTPDRTPREKLSQNQAKALQNSLTAQHGNRQQTPDRTPREKLSQNQAKALQKLTVTAQHRNRQQTPDGTPRENLSQNQAKALQKLTAQQGNRQPTPNKTPRENLSQNQAKPVQKLAAQQGDREQTPDKTSLRNTSFHEGKNQCRKSLGETSQQTLNKTPTSIPKLCSHPRNQQKQRMNVQKEVRALQVLYSILLSYITNKFPLDTVAKNSLSRCKFPDNSFDHILVNRRLGNSMQT